MKSGTSLPIHNTHIQRGVYTPCLQVSSLVTLRRLVSCPLISGHLTVHRPSPLIRSTMTRRQNRPKSTTVVDPIVVKTERDDEEPTALSPSMIRSTPNLPAAQPSSRRESKPKVEQTEVHEDDTDVTEITHRTVGVRAREGSIMSVQEAQVSIDT